MDAAAVVAELRAAAEPFGLPAPGTPALRWGPLFAALDDGDDQEYVTAVELIYEGYLFHYRESRVSLPVDDGRATALLAGDFLYARGLRLIAARGDAGAVGLLARLMAACSYLRHEQAAFATDDALWAYTMGGLAVIRRGVPAATAVGLFDQFDAAAAGGVKVDVVALARASARGLGLRDAAPLEAALLAAAAPEQGAAARAPATPTAATSSAADTGS